MHEPSFRQLAIPAVLCTGVAASLVWAGVTRSAALQVPPPVAYLVAAVMVSAALALVAKAAHRPRFAAWLIVVILAGFAIIGGWAALDATPGACRAGLNGFGFGGRAVECRIGFGLGSLLSVGLTIVAARMAGRASRPTT